MANPSEKNDDNYVATYFEAVLNTYNVLVEAIDKAGERGIKLNRQFVADVAQGQREAIEMSKKIAAEPANAAQYYGAMLEATTNAQSRALSFTQVAYQEALTASTDAREVVEKLVQSSRQVAENAASAARVWAVSNPWTEMFRQQYEAATGAADAAAGTTK